MDAMFLSALVK